MEETKDIIVGEGQCPSRNLMEMSVWKVGGNLDFPKRKSPRIPGYDYATPNYYFITICTHDMECMFGLPNRATVYGKYAEACLLEVERLYPWVKIDKYVVMPNHVHIIFIVSEHQGHQQLSTVIGQYKMAVTKRIRKTEPSKRVWQRSFYDHVIRNQEGYSRIWEYIDCNPMKWEEDCFYRKVDIEETQREGQ